jgi:hypothetical protein
MNAVRTFLFIALSGLLCGSAAAQSAPVKDSNGRVIDARVSQPICGGLSALDRKLLPGCGGVHARYERAAVGSCPAGSTFDIGLWSCWTCPAGYGRTLAAVDTARACSTPDANAKGSYTGARFLGPLCKEGTFFDPIRGGECWRCPDGTRRTAASVEAGDACIGNETLSFAKLERRTAWPHDCSAGTFHDGWDGGACWSCPGANRTAYPVYSDRACSKPAQVHRATVAGKAECQPGEIRDARIQGTQNVDRGGGCWTCPRAWDRSVLPIDGDQACQEGVGVKFVNATKESPLSCAAGHHFDFTGVNDAELSDLKNRKRADSNARSTASGTCWSCPAGTKRTVFGVKSEAACTASSPFVWHTAPYAEPGLFAIPGVYPLALQLLRERTALEAAMKKLAEEAKANVETARAEFWNELLTEPEHSAPLKVAVLAAIITAAENPQSATPAQMAAYRGFEQYVRQRQLYIAKDAIAAYGAWVQADQVQRTVDAQSRHIGMLMDTGMAPPDFHEIAQHGAFIGLTSGAALATGWTVAVSMPAVKFAIFPSAKISARILERTTTKGAEELVKKGAVTFGKVVSKAFAKVGAALQAIGAVGPQIVILIATEAISMEIEKQVAIKDAPGRLAAMAANAANFSVARAAATDSGVEALTAYWALANSVEPRLPAQLVAEFNGVAKVAVGEAFKTETATRKPPVAVAAIAADPRGWPKYFDGTSVLGPYEWVDGPTVLRTRLKDAVVGGSENQQPLAICRAAHQNGVHPGKLVGQNCNIGWGGREIVVNREFQVLVRNPIADAERLFPSNNWVSPNTMQVQATFHGGYEGRNWMRVCRAKHNNGLHVGKEVSGRCNIGWGGREIVLAQYEVLSLFNVAAGGNQTGR